MSLPVPIAHSLARASGSRSLARRAARTMLVRTAPPTLPRPQLLLEGPKKPAPRSPLSRFFRLRAKVATGDESHLNTAEAKRSLMGKAAAAVGRAASFGLRGLARAPKILLVATLRAPAASVRAVRAAPWAVREHVIAPVRRNVTRQDACVFAAFALAAAAPIWAEPLRSALTPPVTVRAERAVLVLPADAPTLWNGVRVARATRAIAPPDVLRRLQPRAPMNPALALTTPPLVVELEPAPLWSPYLANRSVAEIEQDDPYTQGADEELMALETGSIVPAGYNPDDWDGVGPDMSGTEEPGWEPGWDADDLQGGVYAPQQPPPMYAPRPRRRADANVDPRLNRLSGADAFRPGAAAPSGFVDPDQVGADDRPEITIVLTAFGVNARASRDALRRLPEEIAVAVAPIGEDPGYWAERASSEGRVTLLEMPMEPASYPRLDPGPLTLLTENSASQNRDRLEDALTLAPTVDGVATYLGERFTRDAAALEPVIEEMAERGLFVLETRPSDQSQLGRVARVAGVPRASTTLSLDQGGRESDLSDGLMRLEAAARRDGRAIGVAVAVPSTIEQLEPWIAALPERGYRLTVLRP